MEKPYYVHAVWDEDAQVWVASSDDVPGLATEAETAEALVQKLKILMPELLSLNGRISTQPIAFELLTRRFELVT
jgi:predicted RNase H-like HicB family nuclease